MLRWHYSLALGALAVPLSQIVGLPPRIVCTAGGERIYTLESPDSRVQCMSFSRGHIAFVGPWTQVPSWLSWRVTWLQPPLTVLPGLVDAHAHVLEYGEGKTACDLRGARSAGEAVTRVVEYVTERRPGPDEVVIGLGWDQGLWDDDTFPTAQMLDVPALREREIYLKRGALGVLRLVPGGSVDSHAVWISPRLLSRLSLPSAIEGGEIVRDAHGEPTGVFLDAAMEYVFGHLPPWSPGQMRTFLREAAADLIKLGLVGVHDAAVAREVAAFYRREDASGEFPPIRIYGLLDCLNNTFCGDVERIYRGKRFTLRAVKLFADGALGSFGAALLEPYADLPSSRGIMRSPEAAFEPLVRQWHQHGWQVAAHAIGDRANRVITHAFSSVLATEPHPAAMRFRNEHTQIIEPADVRMMATLGVIASMQPTHCTSDMRYAESRLGPDRIRNAYTWQRMIRHGIHLCLSSDAPVEPCSPWRGIYAAVTRLDPETHDSPHGEGGWYAEETLTRFQALAGFTKEAALASFTDHETGTLVPGKRADFIVVDRDVLTITPAEALLATEVRTTVIDGRVVYGKL